MTSMSSDDLASDILDLQKLIAKAERPRVRAILSDYLQQLVAEQQTRKSAKPVDLTPSAVPPAAPKPPVSAPVKMPMPAPISSGSSGTADRVLYSTISSFGWDQDGYGKEPNFVYVYIMSGVDGVGDVKHSVTCDFTEGSFDLKIMGLGGKNLRLKKDNLDKQIVPGESKCIVKKNKVTIKMKKVKGEYGYDSWLDLTAKRPKLDGGKEKDPGASLMDMMKDMYDSGDDNMKKAIGEAMVKSRQNDGKGLDDSPNYDDDFNDPGKY